MLALTPNSTAPEAQNAQNVQNTGSKARTPVALLQSLRAGAINAVTGDASQSADQAESFAAALSNENRPAEPKPAPRAKDTPTRETGEARPARAARPEDDERANSDEDDAPREAAPLPVLTLAQTPLPAAPTPAQSAIGEITAPRPDEALNLTTAPGTSLKPTGTPTLDGSALKGTTALGNANGHGLLSGQSDHGAPLLSAPVGDGDPAVTLASAASQTALANTQTAATQSAATQSAPTQSAPTAQPQAQAQQTADSPLSTGPQGPQGAATADAPTPDVDPATLTDTGETGLDFGEQLAADKQQNTNRPGLGAPSGAVSGFTAGLMSALGAQMPTRFDGTASQVAALAAQGGLRSGGPGGTVQAPGSANATGTGSNALPGTLAAALSGTGLASGLANGLGRTTGSGATPGTVSPLGLPTQPGATGAAKPLSDLALTLDGAALNAGRMPNATGDGATASQGSDAATRNNTPVPLRAEAIAMRIAQQANFGNMRFDIALDPPELGRINVKLEFAQNGKLKAGLSVDRPETLDMLQRDARALEKTLSAAGIDLDDDAMTFTLNDDGGLSDGANNGANDTPRDAFEGLTRRAQTSAQTGDPNEPPTTVWQGTVRPGGVNVTV